VSLAPAIIVCMLEGDFRSRKLFGAEQRPCAICKKPVTVGPAILTRPEMRHPDSSFQCVGCADIEGLELLRPTAAQAAELARNGHAEKWPLEKKIGLRLSGQDVARLRKLARSVVQPEDSASVSYLPAPGTIEPREPTEVFAAAPPAEFRPDIEIMPPRMVRGRQAEILQRNQKEK